MYNKVDKVNSLRKIIYKNLYIRVSKIRQASEMLRFTKFLLLFSPLAVNAQISITSSDMPVSGDTIRYSIAPITDLPDLSRTGANYNWDFSSLGLENQEIYSYLASGKTPYLINFGFTAIGLKIADTLGADQFQLQNVYNFFRSNSNRFEGVGMGFTFGSFPLPQAGKHSDPDEIYRFPLTFGNTANETFSVTIPIMLSIVPVGNVFMTGKRHNEVDGWGSITTPYIQNEPCIRVISVIEETDSVAITTPPLNIGIPVKRIEYKWLSKNEKIPILEISGNETAGRFVPRYIRYRDNYRTPVFTGPKANFSSNKTNVQVNDTVYFTSSSTGPISINQWSISPASGYRFVNGSNANSSDPVVVFEKSGTYDVKLNVMGIRGSDSILKIGYINVSAVGLPEKSIKRALFWPNPSHDILSFNDDLEDIHVFDIQGKELEVDQSKAHELNLSALSAGVYWVQFKTPGGYLTTYKIIKQN